MLVSVDVLLVNASIVMGLWLWSLSSGTDFSSDVWDKVYWFPILNAAWLLVAVVNGFYDSPFATSPLRTTRLLLQLASLLVVTYLLVYFLSPTGSLPRRFFLYFAVLLVFSLGVWRYVYTVFLGRKFFQRRVIILGGGEATDGVAEAIRTHGSPHYELVGLVDDIPRNTDEPTDGLRRAGATAELSEIVHRLGVSEVIVTSIDYNDANLARILIDCQEQGIQITSASAIYEQLTGRVPLSMLSNGWFGVLPLDHPGTGVIFPLAKRLLDLLLATLGLIPFALMFPFLALPIRIDSRGPIFYSQSRLGKGRRVVRAHKLRSMRDDAEADGKAIWAQRGDPRVTGVGRILRATHFDELPQFLNVLLGDMSIVGPRPERPELATELEREIPFYRLRHSVAPGLAGWAVIHQGYGGTLEDSRRKLEYDLYYIKHQSIWLDLFILLKAFMDAVKFRGT